MLKIKFHFKDSIPCVETIYALKDEPLHAFLKRCFLLWGIMYAQFMKENELPSSISVESNKKEIAKTFLDMLEEFLKLIIDAAKTKDIMGKSRLYKMLEIYRDNGEQLKKLMEIIENQAILRRYGD